MIKDKERDSNYELLRIVSMFLIVLWHVITYSKLDVNSVGVTHLIFNFIMFFCIIHVNSYMLITGYYQSKSKFKLKRLLSVIIQLWFYNFIINTVLKLCGLVSYTNIDYILKSSFFNTQAHWYIRCYLIVYLLSPFLNKLINSIDKKMYKKLLITMFMCFSFMPFITADLFYLTNGYNITQYIFLYFIGAYIRKYDVLDNLLSNFNITQKRLIYFSLFLFFLVLNLMTYYFQNYLSTLDSNILKYISGNLYNYKYNYNNPITLLEGLSIFLFFGTFKFKNKYINKIGSLMLGIYLIHQQEYIKTNLYRWLGLYTGEIVSGKMIVVEVIMWAIIIFITCTIIEMLRQIIFKLLCKLKFVKKVDYKIITWINNIFEIK